MGSSLSCQEPNRVLLNKRPNTINSPSNFSLQTSQHSLVVKIMDLKTEDAGSIPDGIINVFALIHRLPRNHKRFLAKTFYGSPGRIQPGTSLSYSTENHSRLQESVELNNLFLESIIIIFHTIIKAIIYTHYHYICH